MIDDDELIFADETDEPVNETRKPAWPVLIVDDEADIHNITRLALAGFEFMGRGLELIPAYSAGEARTILQARNDIAVILLDVVMETENAGLELARDIRETLQNTMVRIILRTGQPGTAPERQVILDYDINDYKAKTELTAQRLFTSMVAALRSYRDVIRIEASRQGLERVIDASVSIFRIQSVENFLSGMMMQISSILGLNDHSMMIMNSDGASDARVIAAIGKYAGMIDREALHIAGEQELALIRQAASDKHTVFGDGRYVFYFTSKHKQFMLYVESENPRAQLDDIERHLIELFCNNFAVAFDNIELHDGMARLAEDLRIFSEDLERKVEARTRDLADEKTRLQEALDNLRRTQDTLIATQKELVIRQKMAALGVMTAGVAHEINNPNNFVSAGTQNAIAQLQKLEDFISQLLADDADPELRDTFAGHFSRLHDQLGLIREGSRRISSIVSGMNSVAQLDHVDRIKLDLAHSLEETLRLTRSGKGADIDFQLDPSGPQQVLAWAGELNQAFMNVLVNAVDAIHEQRRSQPHHAGRIHARMARLPADDTGGNDELHIHFTDNGCGMAPEVVERAFDPFFTTKAVGAGAGLGLSSARDIIRKHGGRMDLESEPGQGATVRIVLPLAFD